MRKLERDFQLVFRLKLTPSCRTCLSMPQAFDSGEAAENHPFMMVCSNEENLSKRRQANLTVFTCSVEKLRLGEYV